MEGKLITQDHTQVCLIYCLFKGFAKALKVCAICTQKRYGLDYIMNVLYQVQFLLNMPST